MILHADIWSKTAICHVCFYGDVFSKDKSFFFKSNTSNIIYHKSSYLAYIILSNILLLFSYVTSAGPYIVYGPELRAEMLYK